MSAYRFGTFVLDVQERRLSSAGTPVPLTPKVFDTLVYLVERHGRLVRKDEIMEAIWGGAHVEEGSLPRTVHVLRKALAETAGAEEPRGPYIETVPTKGYRFVAAVTVLEDDVPAGQPDPLAVPPRDVAAGRVRPGSVVTRASRSGWRRAALVACAALPLLVVTTIAWRTRTEESATASGTLRSGLSTSSGAAYARYQRARLHLERHLPGDLDTALADFEGAIQLDPGFAAAYAGAADARFFRYWDTGAHDDIAQARLAVGHALELDDGSAYAHAIRCRLLGTYDWDFAGAEVQCRRAVHLDPGSDAARRELAFLLSSQGRHAEALEEMDAAVRIAPTSFNKRSRGHLLYFARRFDDALAQLRQVEATDSEYRGASRWIARCLEQKQEYGAALDALIRHRESAGAAPAAIGSLRRAFAAGGWPGVLRASLPDRGSAPDLETAGTYAQLGDADAAFEVLGAMISARRVMTVHMDSEPRLDPVRDDPRFEELARRVGLR